MGKNTFKERLRERTANLAAKQRAASQFVVFRKSPFDETVKVPLPPKPASAKPAPAKPAVRATTAPRLHARAAPPVEPAKSVTPAPAPAPAPSKSAELSDDEFEKLTAPAPKP